ncbi:MAG TPA: TIGR03668 family PPOX class F420-dependent oxidoreductase [Actinomycetota bacterium]|jgi:PPOX class probable F420-dependent enzyme|nr:TIGR03668 family PPOX class F420-dependent oxidoreductase [Actinomycetota bacterium]
MASGSCAAIDELPARPLRVLTTARTAVLATVSADGSPHVVPVCFAVRASEVVTAVDHKPKTEGRPARLRNIERDPRTALLVHHYSEDWDRLAWIMLRCRARLEPPGYGREVLIPRYEQYRSAPPVGEVIALEPHRILWWTYSGDTPS